MTKSLFASALAALLITGAAPAIHAQEPTQAQKDQWAREGEERLHTDWGYLGRYGDADASAAPTAVKGAPRVVFLGDSITQGWFDQVPGFFTPGRFGRGISGQTTPQMLVRFRQDVIALHPDVVQIMAATNDIAGNTGPMTDAETEANFMSMVEMAHAHGIRVILASIPPADHFPWRPGLETGQHIARLNAWLKDYARRSGSVYADYWSALNNGGLGFHEGWSSDGVHPNRQGYAAMAPVAEAAIRQAMSRPAPHSLDIARAADAG